MKYIPYGRQSIDTDDIREVIKVLKSDWLTQGPKVDEFERALAKYCGVKYAVAVSSGTAALHIACLAAGIGHLDEAITSPITFVASANCILYCAGKPVFADVQRDTINIDPEEIKKKITKKTKAIIPVHFAGHPCDMEEIAALANKHKLIIIEDACHALGARYQDKKIGACEYSDMAVFSFHPIKSITTGEGGAITTNHKSLYLKLKALRSHGIYKTKALITRVGPWHYEMQELGFNYRITDFQCALGISQLKRINGFLNKRRELACVYSRAFKDIGLFDLPIEKSYVKSSWHLYPVRLKAKYKNKRKQIFARLKKSGIGVQVHYVPVYLQPYYKRNLAYHQEGLFPVAEEYYKSAITLPLYYRLSNSDIKYIVSILEEILSSFRGL